MKENPTRFLVIVSHSLGEFDTLFPLFARLKNEYSIEVEIIIAVRSIFDQYRSSPFLQFCGENIGINVRYFKLPNKFDSVGSLAKVLSGIRLGRKIAHICTRITSLLRTPALFHSLISSNYYLHEISNQFMTTRILYVFNFLLKKPILTYHHGPGVIKSSAAQRRIQNANLTTHLSFHEHNRFTLVKLGFSSQVEIGYPQFFYEWQKLVSEFVQKDETIRENIVIFTRGVHAIYLDEEDFIYLLQTSCKVVRKKLGNVLIIIKPHPRQDKAFLREILSQIGLSNYRISEDHAAVLSKKAKIAIAFFGSTILHSLSVGTPAIEYNIEAKRFREAEPEGSPYKKLAIHSASNQRELAQFFDEVISGEYVKPEIADEMERTPNFSIEHVAR